MKKINSLIVGLTLSLVILLGIAVEQHVSANLPGPGLGCDDLTGCRSANTCDDRGQASGCTINCENGGTVTCPK